MTDSNDHYRTLAWYNRKSDSLGYHVALATWFIISFWMLMGIPYWYDQANKRLFVEAAEHNGLVIREFQGAFVDAEREACSQAKIGPPFTNNECSSEQLYSRLKERRLIALDYIEKMQSAQELSFFAFLGPTFMVFVFTLIALVLVSKFVQRSLGRFSLMFLILFGSFSGLPLAIPLPHKNVKFYFTVGILFTILLPFMDYLHRLGLFNRAGEPEVHAEALKLRHRKWTRLLTVALTLLIALLGTISFNIIDYETAIFGEGFIYYPLLGVVVVLIVCVAAFCWGVIRNILLILEEIEDETGKSLQAGTTTSES